MSASNKKEVKQKGRGDLEIDPEEMDKRIEEALHRIAPLSPKIRSYFRGLLKKMITSNAVPIELFEGIPLEPGAVGKTRFDQIYDASMYLAFPGYRKTTLKKLLGPGIHFGPDTKIWRAIFPEKFGVSHVIIRAPTYQRAFALACDYACRMSLRSFGNIPPDLTIRVIFMTEKAIRRMLHLRWANRVIKRRKLQLIGRVYSHNEVMGAKYAALGNPKEPEHSIAKYVEGKDLERIMSMKEKVRISAVEAEVRHKDYVSPKHSKLEKEKK